MFVEKGGATVLWHNVTMANVTPKIYDRSLPLELKVMLLLSTDCCLECLELTLKPVVWTHVGTQDPNILQRVGVAHSLREHEVPVTRTQFTGFKSF